MHELVQVKKWEFLSHINTTFDMGWDGENELVIYGRDFGGQIGLSPWGDFNGFIGR